MAHAVLCVVASQPLPSLRPPMITGNLGIPGSASTWVFNVVRELMMAAHGDDNVHAVFSDAIAPVLADPRAQGRHVVWKLHAPDQGWSAFAALTQARVVLTLRDPRDAMLSLMQRFAYDITVACAAIRVALRSVAAAAESGAPMLRYETRFFDAPETVTWLAQFLDLTVGDGEMARIFAAYATANVRRFGATLHALPQDRVQVITHSVFDGVTQIHRTHIGDQLVGKWRSKLSPAEQRMSTALFTPWLQEFGYDPV